MSAFIVEHKKREAHASVAEQFKKALKVENGNEITSKELVGFIGASEEMTPEIMKIVKRELPKAIERAAIFTSEMAADIFLANPEEETVHVDIPLFDESHRYVGVFKRKEEKTRTDPNTKETVPYTNHLKFYGSVTDLGSLRGEKQLRKDIMNQFRERCGL